MTEEQTKNKTSTSADVTTTTIIPNIKQINHRVSINQLQGG